MIVQPFRAAAFAGLLAAAPAAAQTNISVGPFRTIELNGGGRVLVRHAPAQQVRIVQGNARISAIHLADRPGPSGRKAASDRLVIDTCPNRCPMGYQLVVEVDTPAVTGLGVNGDGRIEVASGFPRAASLAAGVKGKGGIDARALAADRVSAGISGNGDISLGRVETLAAGVKGHGRIVYRGHPRVVSSAQGGGRIEHAD